MDYYLCQYERESFVGLLQSIDPRVVDCGVGIYDSVDDNRTLPEASPAPPPSWILWIQSGKGAPPPAPHPYPRGGVKNRPMIEYPPLQH